MNKDTSNAASSQTQVQQQQQQQQAEERFKHFWETKKSAGNGMKMNYIWHSRQFFFALVPSLAVIFVGEIMRRKLKAVQNVKDGGAVPLTDNEDHSPPVRLGSANGASNVVASGDSSKTYALVPTEELDTDEQQRRSERQQLAQSVASLQAQLDELKRGLSLAPSGAVGAGDGVRSPIEQRNVHRMKSSKTGPTTGGDPPATAATANATDVEGDKATKLTAAVLGAMGAAAADLTQTLPTPTEAAGKLVEWARGVLSQGQGKQGDSGCASSPEPVSPKESSAMVPSNGDTKNDDREAVLAQDSNEGRGMVVASAAGAAEPESAIEPLPTPDYSLLSGQWLVDAVDYYQSWWTWSGLGASAAATGTSVTATGNDATGGKGSEHV